jgi:hypothetical protein
MRTLGMIALSLGLGTASLARADVPVNPMTLGSVDAVLTFCGQLNPAGASAYGALRESLIGKQSERAREAVTQTPAYRDGFAQISRVLKSAPRDWAVRACNDLMPGPGEKAQHGHRPSRPTGRGDRDEKDSPR